MVITPFHIAFLPFLIIIGQVYHKHTFHINEQLHRTSFRTQDPVRLTVNFILEIQPCTGMVHITCMHHRHIVQCQRSIEPLVQVVNRSVDTGPLHVGISYARIMSAERLPSILKISNVSPMPDPPHRINFTELHPYAANILKPALGRGEVQIIGATTPEEYRRHIEKDAALERRFQPVKVGEPDREQTMEMLRSVRTPLERHHGVRLTAGAMRAAYELSVRYINDRFLPDKAIDLLDEAAAAVHVAGERITVETQDVAQVVSMWTGVPVTGLDADESLRLLTLEKQLRERIIGQDEAVSAVARAIRRGRVGLKDPGRPVGSFLFLGPTGVGKTELCRALAATVYGDEGAIIRLDMSEYMEKHSVSRLIGSPPGYVGYEDGGQLTEKVRRKPWSVVLFDEIEKAHEDVWGILLQIMDDGHLTDSAGRRIDFSNTVIVMTSNIGAKAITENRPQLGFTGGGEPDGETMRSRVMEELRATFRPEFLNRVDETIIFRRLGEEDMLEITQTLLTRVAERFNALGLELSVPPETAQWLAHEGYDERFGARPLRRTLQHSLEDTAADMLLDGRIARGDRVMAEIADGGIILVRDGGS